MNAAEAQLRRVVADYSRRLHSRGWVANHDGNLSVRLAGGRFLCTPGATSKAEVSEASLVVVDQSGAVVGRGRVFSEIGLHLTVYRQRADVGAVVHAHPVTASGFGAAGCALDVPFWPEAVVSLGPGVPLVPLAAPGPAAAEALAPYVADHDAVLLAGNGVLAWGVDVEQAYLRLELVEHLARIALVAHQLGGVRPLPAALLPPLLEARKQAGLGPQARGQRPAAVPSMPSVPAADLAAIIRQEITAALKG
ncbi:MAG: class II aldolase/adducin family protein [Myxococcales bacterium]|nr:class II aldolase/adducin family protein [Myxococcales bacterium]